MLFWMKYFFRKLCSFSCCLSYYKSSVIVYFKRFTITLSINKGAYPHHIFVRLIMSFQVAVFEPYPQFNSVQLLSCVWLFATPWAAAHQSSLSITNSQSLLKLISIESVVPSSHLILCHPLLLPSIFPSNRVFSNESALHIGGQSVGVSASTSVLPKNIQDWSPLGWTGWFSLQSKGLSRVLSNTTVQKHQFFGTQLSL